MLRSTLGWLHESLGPRVSPSPNPLGPAHTLPLRACCMDGEMDGWGVKELRAPANPACVCRPDSSLHKKQA